ncbi:MAG: hypothetical protein ABWZ15_08010 [Acidimicrobiia bacterium]
MSIDLEQQLRAYGRVLDDAVAGAPRSRPRRTQLLVAAAIVIVVGAGALVIAARDDADPGVIADDVTTTTSVAALPTPEVVATSPAQLVPPRPLALAGGDVWIAAGSFDAGGRISQHLERRDARTGALIATIEVPQEAVSSIAAANIAELDVVVLAGGGDGSVPQTTVSAVDVATNTVLFTHTLTDANCSCRIVAGAGALWLGGDGVAYVLRLDPSTGELVERIELPGPARVLAAVDDRLLAGLLDENGFVVIDPRTNTVEWNRRAELTEAEPAARIATIAPATGDGPDHSAWILRTDGKTFIVSLPSGIGAVHSFGFAPRDAVDTGNELVTIGGSYIGIRHNSQEPGTAYLYDRQSQTFRSAGAKFAPVSYGGLTQVVAVDDTLWIYDWQHELLVVRL